jgi:hypothetical protein
MWALNLAQFISAQNPAPILGALKPALIIVASNPVLIIKDLYLNLFNKYPLCSGRDLP